MKSTGRNNIRDGKSKNLYGHICLPHLHLYMRSSSLPPRLLSPQPHQSSWACTPSQPVRRGWLISF